MRAFASEPSLSGTDGYSIMTVTSIESPRPCAVVGQRSQAGVITPAMVESFVAASLWDLIDIAGNPSQGFESHDSIASEDVTVFQIFDREIAATGGNIFNFRTAWQARGNQSPAAEYNIAIDPESARIVFDRFENVVVLPWEVSLDQGMPWERLHRIANGPSPRARFLKAMTPLTMRWQVKYKFSGVPLPDPMAVMLALRPVTQIVRLDDPERSLHPDQCARPSECALDPFPALEGPVDQPPVKANRMAAAHGDEEQRDENREC